MRLVGWVGLPRRFVEVGGYHFVETRDGVERLRCTSAGSGDARFVRDAEDNYRVVVVPWEQWAAKIRDLREADAATT